MAVVVVGGGGGGAVFFGGVGVGAWVSGRGVKVLFVVSILVKYVKVIDLDEEHGLVYAYMYFCGLAIWLIM